MSICRRDHLRPALDILSDAVFNSTLPEEEYAKEMEVIRREFAMGRDNPDSELGKLIFQTAFTRHPYRHPVIGHLDLFNQITRADVLAYYHERYVPQNQTLIVVGAVQPDAVFALAEEILAKYPRRPMGEVFLPEEPPCAAPRRLRQEFATQLGRLALAWPIPGLEHPDTPALDVLSIVAGGGVSSRLNQSCVEEESAGGAHRGLLLRAPPLMACGVSRPATPPRTRRRCSRRFAPSSPS